MKLHNPYHQFTRLFSCFLAGFLTLLPLLTTAFPDAYGSTPVAGSGSPEDPFVITSADQFPSQIDTGTYYILDADIILTEGQQITTLAGALDGKGHTVTLANLPLAGTISGTVQNLGVTGSIICSDTSGSMAQTLTGQILNCYSTVTLDVNNWLTDVAGLAGVISGGSIYNSYYAGTRPDFTGGLVVSSDNASSLIQNCYATGGAYDTVSTYTGNLTIISSDIRTRSDFQSGSMTKSLNQDLPATGYYWVTKDASVNQGMPVLQAGDVSDLPVDKQALQNAIAKADALCASSDLYTEDSVHALTEALETARQLDAASDPTQDAVDAAVDALNLAISGLKKKKFTEPLALPPDQVIHIQSESDLSSLSDTDGHYYVLDNDITLSSSYMNMNVFQGVLDGQGHRILFEDSITGLFDSIGENGVIQNLQLDGTLNYVSGPLGKAIQGSVINVSSAISGDGTAGFATRLEGGMLSNCYSVSPAGNGALFKNYVSGTLRNTYWQSDLKAFSGTDIPESAKQNAYPKSADYMKSKEFYELLNRNRGTYGVSWGQSSDGYPYFGTDQTYEPGTPILPQNKTRIVFTKYDGSESISLEEQMLLVSPDLVDNVFHIAGSFSLPDYVLQAGESIEWSCETSDPALSIGADEGNLRVDGNGTVIVTATLRKANGTTEVLAACQVIAKREAIQEIRLFIDGTDVTNGTYSVQGSEEKHIQVQAKFADSSDFVTIASSGFTYEAASQETIYSTPSSSAFYFLHPGTSVMTVTSKTDARINAQVTITSEYVPAVSVRPAIRDEIIIHGRNANSSNGKNFLPDYSAVIVEPENASYCNNWTITSSDPSVASYISSMVKGYVPYKAGTTTFTVTLTDIDPATGQARQLTGAKTVTYRYQNPLTRVTAEESDVELKNGDILPLHLTFTGAMPETEYSVTEPELIWTYSTNGIVRISRRENGYWKRNTAANDNNMYIASTDYYIYAESEGTVTATGTPVDTTGNAKPVVITITVTKGNLIPVDTDALLRTGIDNAIQAVSDAYAPYGYHYGDEWAVYAILQAGGTIPDSQLNSYYQEVAAAVSTWSNRQKPTDIERVALTLSLIGKDITNINGTNLAAMIYNHPNLDSGSNELIFALLALDARGTAIPEDAAWSREDMIEALLTFQNPVSGGFGLYDAANEGDIDLTAMAIQALSDYTDTNPAAAQAVQDAYVFLKDRLTPEYGYAEPESGAQVLLALAASKSDLKDTGFGTLYRNLVSQLSGYVADPCPVNMSTLQILEAFEAYRRYRADETPYWKHTGAFSDESASTPDDATPPDSTTQDSSSAPLPGTESAASAEDTNGSHLSTAATGDPHLPYVTMLILSASVLVFFAVCHRRRLPYKG